MTIKQSPLSQEIDLIVVAKTLWAGKRKLFFFVIGFAAFGLLMAFLTPKEYTAQTIWVNQSESSFSGNSGVEGIAAMVGFDMRAMEGTNELTPVDYPDFIESLSFQYALMHTPLQWKRFDESVSLYTFYAEYYKPSILKTIRNYTIGLPGMLLNRKKADSKSLESQVPESRVPRLNSTEVWVRYILLDNLEMTLNEGNNMITLETVAPDAVAAAELARCGEELLKEMVTNLKIDKAKNNLEFTQRLYDEKKAVFELAQGKLAQFLDRNMNLGSERARTEQEMLESEYQIAFSVYSEMATELETAKIRIEEDTPMFSVVEEAIVPNRESKPKKVTSMLVWAFLGGFIAFVWVLAGPLLKKAKVRWRELGE